MKGLVVTVGLVLGLVIAPRVVPGQHEPLNLSGTWVGTWWMGKYEEPMQLELVQTAERLAGTVVLEGYPRSEGADAASVHPSVTGVVQGEHATLAWVVGTTPFSVDLTLTRAGVLTGLGGDAHGLTTGFTLRRLGDAGRGDQSRPDLN